MAYSVAYAERLFIGSVDCDARFTHAVAKGFLLKYEPLHRGSELFVCCFS